MKWHGGEICLFTYFYQWENREGKSIYCNHICEVAADKNEFSCWCIHMLLCLVVECRKSPKQQGDVLRFVCCWVEVLKLNLVVFTLRFSLWFRDVSPWLFRVSLTKRQVPGTFVWYRVLCRIVCFGKWFIAQECARCIYIIWIWTGMGRSKQATWKCNMLNVHEKVLLIERSCYWAQVDGIYRWLVYGLLTFSNHLLGCKKLFYSMDKLPTSTSLKD